MRTIILILISVLWSSSAQAAEFYQGIRQMGMGGAATAVVNDETSLLLNPIGLGRLREPYITLIDPEVTSNMNSLTATQNLAGTGITDMQKLYDEVSKMQDKQFFNRYQMFPSVVNRDYGFGFLAKYDVTAKRPSSGQDMNLNYTSDWAAVGGINHSFAGGIVKVGASGKIVDRVQYNGVVNPATTSMNITELANEGVGVGVDVGVSLSSPTAYLPTLSVIAKDVGGTSFSLSQGYRNYMHAQDPAALPMTVDAAFAVFPIHANNMRSTFTIEYSDLTKAYEQYSSKQRLHIGYEVNVYDQLFFRAGYNRGYVTGGFEWAFRVFQLQLAYYNEEVGDKDNPVRDERVAFKAVFRF